MKISNLINAEDKVIGNDCEINSLSCDSKKIEEDTLFFCINGTHNDGHKFALDAVKKGAKAVVCERELNLPQEITQIVVGNSRKAMGEMASKFYNNPQKDMKIIMVTGTNGKTTTTYILKKILEDAGYKVGVIGTNGTQIADKHINSNLTTPDPIELFELLSKMKEEKCDFVCMEASAHALALDKLAGLNADISVLTNITQDHLDFFKNMESYAAAKEKLFKKGKSRIAIFNADDYYGDLLFHKHEIPCLSYGIDENADIKAEYVTQNRNGQSFIAHIGSKTQNFDIQLDGKFNISNALAGIAVAEVLGIEQKNVAKSLETFPPVAGRFNKIDKNGVHVVIDYAHTPDGVANILSATKQMAGKNKVIAVFGCGGNRDAAKRPLMGNIACSLADYAVITSDNPRYEEPEQIIQNICQGTKGFKNYETIVDRKEAIKKAISLANVGDVVAILGKGNEDYLDIEGVKVPYSDKSVVDEIETDLIKE